MKLVRIHKGNYEAFMLDRMEGRLPYDLSKELDLFLAQNPQLAEDLEGLNELSFTGEPVAFDAGALKKSEFELVDEHTFVAYIENQLASEDRLFVEKSAANNLILQQELDLFKKTILEADAGIVYTPKSELKRKPKVIWLNPQLARYAAAAVLLLFLGLVFLWTRQQPHDELANNSGKGVKKTSPAVQQPSQKEKPKNLLFNNEQANPAIHQASNNDAIKQVKDQPAESSLPQETLVPKEENLVADQQPAHQDSVQALVVAPSSNTKENQPVAVSATHKVIPVTVIEEDEDAAASKKKNTLWALAGKTLKGLNKAGLKAVDGNEKDSHKTTEYSLTVGGFEVTHSENMD